MKTGSFAPPKLNVGAEGSVGIGPVSLGGKVGFGAGGYGGPGDTLYYDSLTEEKVGAEGVHLGGSLGLGVGDVSVSGGAGLAGGLKDGQSWPSLRVPTFVRYNKPFFCKNSAIKISFYLLRNIPGYIRAIPSYIPSISLPSWGWGSDATEVVEYDVNDTEGWVNVPQQSSWAGNILGIQVTNIKLYCVLLCHYVGREELMLDLWVSTLV